MKRTFLLSLVLSLLFCFSYIAVSSAGTYYVAPNGTATWAQATNINTPTNGRTAMQNAVAGDIVYFRGGTYTPSNDGVPIWSSLPESGRWNIPAWTPTNSGTSGNPITFIAYPGETPIITHYIYGPVIGSYRSDYIVWDGFQGSKIGTQSFAHFSGLDDFLDSPEHCIIQNCVIQGYNAPGFADNNRCIGCRYARYLTIRNNYLYGSHGTHSNSNGVQFYWTTDSIIENNTFYDNMCGFFDKGGANARNIIRYNFFLNNHHKDIQILAHQEDDKVYQNVIVGSTNSAMELEGESSTYNRNHKVYNNTIYATSYNGICYRSQNEQQWNNIVINATGNAYRSKYLSGTGDGQPTYMDYNCYWRSGGGGQTFSVRYDGTNPQTYTTLSAWQTSRELLGGGNPDVHSIYANPLFVNAGGTTPEDYKLQANSPCRNAGRDGVTMGAYITGNEIIGYVGGRIIDIIPPAIPTGLQIVTTSSTTTVNP